MPRDDDDVDGNEFGSTLISFPQICLAIEGEPPHTQSPIITPANKKPTKPKKSEIKGIKAS